jgi:glycosyltransferase involved in cell wall biosynthesis
MAPATMKDLPTRAPRGAGDTTAPTLTVVYVINQLGPGGAEKSLSALIPHFGSAGIRMIVACLKDYSAHYPADAHPPCEVRLLEGSSWLAKARSLRRLLREVEADLVHTTLFDADLVGRLAAVGTGVPVLSSLVSTTYEPARLLDPGVSRLSLAAVKLLDQVTAHLLTDHFHAITEAVRESAVRTLKLPPARITVIGRGRPAESLPYPAENRRRVMRAELGVADDEVLVVNVGRQEYAKGQRYLLRAFEILAGRVPNVRLLVVGRRGNASAELDRLLASSAAADRIRFAGSRDDVPDLLAAADVFVFPSVYEGLGGAVIEAMAMGLPVVASDLPALREVVEDGRNGVLVPPSQPDALASALENLLLSQETAAAFGRRSREIFLERFQIEQIADRMVAMYRDVVRRYSR